MLGIDERTIRVAWTIFLFGLLLAIVYYIRETLVLFTLAIFFAYMLWPLVVLVERFLPQRRNIALAVVYCAFIGVLVVIGIQLIPEIGSEARAVTTQLPALFSPDRISKIPLPGVLRPFQEQIVSAIRSQLSGVQSHVLPLMQRAGTQILASLGALLPMILIPILAFFFLKDSQDFRVTLIGAVEPGQDRGLMTRILDDVHTVLRSYIRALVMLAIVAFVVWLVFLSVMRYPFQLLLAALAGVGEFIPVIGPAVTLVTMLIVCAVAGSGGLLWLLIFWGLYRMFADYVLNPYLMSSGVELHPLLVLFGVLAGENIAGIPGMFFSIPVIAIARVIYLDLRKAYVHRQLSDGVPVKVRVAAPSEVPGGLIINPVAKTEQS